MQLGEFAVSKLTSRHVKLTSYSKMSVKLAAQILSESVGKLMLKEIDKAKASEMEETARFVLMMDRWFDYMNTRPGRGKPSLRVYT